jgi:hypothetical protein
MIWSASADSALDGLDGGALSVPVLALEISAPGQFLFGQAHGNLAVPLVFRPPHHALRERPCPVGVSSH